MRIPAFLFATMLAFALLQAPSPAHADDVTVSPIPSLTGSYGGSDPVGIAVDASGGRWIKSNDQVRYFPRGTTTATKTIGGASALIGFTGALAVDTHGALYVPSNNSIKVFAPGANGNVAPFRSIAGPNTGLSSVSGIDVDANGFIYVTDTDADSLSVFAPSATGDAHPMYRIAGGRSQIINPLDVRRSGATMWVSNPGSQSILGFAFGAEGNVAPQRVIGGYLSRLSTPQGVDVDNGGNIYVANGGFTDDQVLVFAPTANGNVAPARVVTVSGRSIAPNEIAVDSRRLVHLANINFSTTDVLPAIRTVVASAPRSLKVSGTSTASTRTLSWAAPSFDGYATITQYQVQVKAGTTVRVNKTLAGGARKLALSRSTLGKGTRTAYVRARNVSGWSAWAKVSFVVR